MAAGGAAAPLGEHASASRCRDIFPLPPLLKATSPCTSKSSRVRGRVRRQQRAQDLAASAIDALNSLYAAPSGTGRCRDPLPSLCSAHVAEVHQYIFDCCYEFAGTPESFDESASHLQLEAETEAYDDFNSGGPTNLISDMVALSTNGGKFPVADYVGPDLAAYAYAEPPACDGGDMVSQFARRGRAIASRRRSTPHLSFECAKGTWPSSSRRPRISFLAKKMVENMSNFFSNSSR